MGFLPLPSVEVGMTIIIDYVMARHDGIYIIKRNILPRQKIKK
jgi:hypothetical protein